MSDIERIPSMRKDAKQGVPKQKPRDMAKPMAEAGKTKDAPSVAPRAMAAEPQVPEEPHAPEEPQVPEEPTLPLELASEPEMAPINLLEPEQEPEAQPVALSAPEPEEEPEPESEAEPSPEPGPEPTPEVQAGDPLPTMRAMFARVEPAFQAFRDAAYRYPSEHMNDHIGDEGWTRKQMLSHVAAWHDLTTDRLLKMAATGRPVPLDRAEDAINGAAARIAIGKSVGEVLKDVEASYARLRRQMLRMTDADLRLGDDWAAHVIAGNTYEHYTEHMADLAPPVALPGSGAQR